MNDILYLQPSSNSSSTAISGKTQSPADVGNSIFQNLLNQGLDSTGDGSLGPLLFKGTPSTAKQYQSENLKGMGTCSQDDLGKKMPFLYLSSSQFVLPESALPQLVAFLKDQGFSKEKINQLLISLKNKDGLVQVDKLMALIMNGESAHTAEKNSPLIQSSQIPGIEELLFNMGLGAGEIKESIEKSLNQKGDLVLGRLWTNLEKYLPGIPSESGLISMLKQHDIQIKSQVQFNDMKAIDPDLKKELMNFIGTPSQDFQKKIKQNIAEVLREKGIPPQEVKSFLETLNVDYTKSLLKDNTIKKPELDLLLNQAFLKKQPEWQRGGWHEKIMGILKEERLLIGNDANANKALLPEQGVIRINLTELLKHGGTNTKPELFPVFSEDRIEVKDTKTTADRGDRGFLIKDALGTDLTVNRTDRDSRMPGAVSQVRNYYNLPQPLPKILDRMIWMIRAGEQRGRMLIHPPELGRLDLDLAIKNGHLHANLSAENPLVKEVIEANLNQLKQQLSNQGLTVDSFEVMVGLEDRQFKEGFLWSRQDRENSSSSKRPGLKGDISVMDGESAGRSRDKQYQIDVHV